MVIDSEHPFAPYVVPLREGAFVPNVERIDTSVKQCWELDDDPGSMGIDFDEVGYLPHVPSHLRDLLPPHWRPVDLLD